MKSAHHTSLILCHLVVATDVRKQPGARVAVLAKVLVHQVASVHEVQVQGCWSGWAWSVPAAGQAAAAPIKPDRRQLSAGPQSRARNAQLCTEHLPRGKKIISGPCRNVSWSNICEMEVCYHHRDDLERGPACCLL